MNKTIKVKDLTNISVVSKEKKIDTNRIRTPKLCMTVHGIVRVCNEKSNTQKKS